MNIVLLDTGCANLSSVKWAIHKLGYNVTISKDINVILNSHKILLPGVGTPSSAMEELNKNNLISILKSYKNPILGICLGMQIMGKVSYESVEINNLNIFDINVRRLDSKNFVLPHIGWNKVNYYTNNILFKGIKPNSWFYFLHSYAMPLNKYTIADCYYGSFFSAAVQKDNYFGVQFHPEKSGNNGSKLLKNFIEI
ncbi:Imidazole glycerol phosphate synthase subunit HisH [Buchnera aphidicola (Neophyllaphis podocarpi)]|uniref:imidazole glycerol phosphate synthase subunit HisH n=1 Tax=Buchnera aphidicola TaxID=9 RepID=UPI003464370A